jgi:hypothetical protein
VLCDLLARTLLAPVEIPVGVVTAIVGGPFFCGCSSARPDEAPDRSCLRAAPDDRGRLPQHARRRRRAQRIVSLVPAVTEMLFAIGAGPQVVGVSSYDHPSRSREKLPKVGRSSIRHRTHPVAAARPGRRLADRHGGPPKEAGIDLNYRHGARRHPGHARQHHGPRRRRPEAQAHEVGADDDRLTVRMRVAGLSRPRTCS